MQDIYTNYLLSQNNKASATHLARLLKNIISHDQVTKFLNKKEYSSKDLWQYLKNKIHIKHNNNEKFLIIDDTISEKPYTKENEINSWHFDHSKGRYQKGINIFTCFYKTSDIQVPVAYEIIKKDKYYSDTKTGKIKRKASITKNEHFKNCLDTCIKNNVDFDYVLGDSWYGSKSNMKYINELNKKFVLGVKSNRLFKMYDESSKTWTSYSQLKNTEIKSDRSYLIKLKECNILLTLLKKVFKNGDGSVGTLYIVSNDLTLNSSTLYDKLYKKRWSIEVYHKDIKNHASLSKSPTKTSKTQSTHIYMSIISYCKLEMLKNKSMYKSQHNIKELLLIKANQATMQELIKLQKQFKVSA